MYTYPTAGEPVAQKEPRRENVLSVEFFDAAIEQAIMQEMIGKRIYEQRNVARGLHEGICPPYSVRTSSRASGRSEPRRSAAFMRPRRRSTRSLRRRIP